MIHIQQIINIVAHYLVWERRYNMLGKNFFKTVAGIMCDENGKPYCDESIYRSFNETFVQEHATHDDIEMNIMSIMNYIKSGKEVIDILAKIDSGEISPEEGLEMIKKMDADIIFDTKALIKDVESQMRAQKGDSSEKMVQEESVPETAGEKGTMSLKEAIQETPLGQRLFTKIEEVAAPA